MKCIIRLGLLLPICLVFFLIGCSKNPNAPAKVSGKVTYKGNAVSAGTITFTSSDRGSVSTAIKSDGTYEATDLPVGEFVVTIETESANPNLKVNEYKGGGSNPFAGKFPKGKGPPNMAKEREKAEPPSPKPSGAQGTEGAYVQIPAKYADPAGSNLKVTLSKGSNKNDFDLTD